MTIKTKLSEFAETTSMHGVAHISSSPSWFVKIFWVIVVFGGIAICAWYVYLSVSIYLTYPVLVKTEIKFEQLPFPAVTICNLNPIRASKLNLVPKLQQLLSVCNMQVDKNVTKQATDFCTSYRAKNG